MTQDFLPSPNDNPNPLTPPTPPANIPSGREPIKHILYGSHKAVTSTIHVLQVLGYAEVGAWSPPQHTQNPGEVVSIMTRNLRFE